MRLKNSFLRAVLLVTLALQFAGCSPSVQTLKKKAEQGDVEAQHHLGVRYHRGYGVPQDYKEALKWYRKAAEQWDFVAQNNLGVMYSKGEGGPQDHEEAAKWFRLAAEQGDVYAQSNMGSIYDEGRGVPQGWQKSPAQSSCRAARQRTTAAGKD